MTALTPLELGLPVGPRYEALMRKMGEWTGANPEGTAADLGRMMLNEIHALETELKDAEARADQAEAKLKEAEERLRWLSGHCRALGMVKKSISGKPEHDIALFTADLKDSADQATREVRDKTIEECAAVCDAVATIYKDGQELSAKHCADSVRALSDKQPEEADDPAQQGEGRSGGEG